MFPKNKTRSLLFVAICISAFSCSILIGNKVGKKYTTKSGIKFKIETKGSGVYPVEGDKIKLHFIGKLVTGDKFASSYDRGRPIVFTLGKGQVIKGWDEILPKLTIGSKVSVEIPSELGYGEQGLGKVPPNTDLTYYFELIEIIEPPVPYNVLSRDTFKLESGLQYLISESSTGQMAESFRSVTVHYTGYLEDGNIFDSSVERGFPFEFDLGKDFVIAGWEEGILHMREGEKFRFIVPPSLAYGDRGFPPTIPGNALLIYDVELLKIN